MSDRPISKQDARMSRLLLTHEVAEFLYREAELLDERRYDEWLDVLAEDIRYWMPMRRNIKFGEGEREFTREGQDIAWFDEGKDTLVRRVKQIQTGIHWAEEPQSRISHLVTNVQLAQRLVEALSKKSIAELQIKSWQEYAPSERTPPRSALSADEKVQLVPVADAA